MPDSDMLMLYSHWVAADSIREVIRQPINGIEKINSDLAGPAALLSISYRMLIFYALLYVVIESYKEKEVSDQKLDKLLENPLVDNLRRLRNAVFHIQKTPFTPKIWEFMNANESEQWISDVHKAFNVFFTKELKLKEMLNEMESKANENT